MVEQFYERLMFQGDFRNVDMYIIFIIQGVSNLRIQFFTYMHLLGSHCNAGRGKHQV